VLGHLAFVTGIQPLGLPGAFPTLRAQHLTSTIGLEVLAHTAALAREIID
jgi:hypothetical protein